MLKLLTTQARCPRQPCYNTATSVTSFMVSFTLTISSNTNTEECAHHIANLKHILLIQCHVKKSLHYQAFRQSTSCTVHINESVVRILATDNFFVIFSFSDCYVSWTYACNLTTLWNRQIINKIIYLNICTTTVVYSHMVSTQLQHEHWTPLII